MVLHTNTIFWLDHVRYLSCSGPRVVHFSTYPFQYQSDVDVTFGTTTRSALVPFWTTSVPEILNIW